MGGADGSGQEGGRAPEIRTQSPSSALQVPASQELDWGFEGW